MKVLLIAENWPPRVGGIERYLTGLADELGKTHQVTVIAPHASNETPTVDSPVSVIRKRFFWPVIKPSWLPLYIFIHRLAQQEKFDIILCGKGLFEGLVGYYLQKRLGIPYFVFTYAMEIEEWLKASGSKRKLQRVLQNARTVVVINDVTKNRLLESGVSENQIRKIYPAVDEQFLQRLQQKENHEAVIKKYDIRKPYILTVARLIPRKGVDDLIRAYAKLDQKEVGTVDLVIAGSGPQPEELKTLASELKVQPKFLGYVPDEDLPALYTSAELFALTPKEIKGDIEGFGIVYLEAGAAGVPVVGTRTAGVLESVIPDRTGLLTDSKNIDGIAQSVTQLLTNPELRQRLGDAGKKRVQDMFTWQKQIMRLLQ